MKKIIFFTLCITISAFTHSTETISIKSIHSSNYIGKNLTVCGPINQIKYFKSGIYLNFDSHYPNHSMTGVLWQDTANEYIKKYGKAETLINKKICINGLIKSYNGKPQISINNILQLSIE